jgi:hypothetical protein
MNNVVCRVIIPMFIILQILSSFISQKIDRDKGLRILRSRGGHSSIYYSIPKDFPINNVTGTGNKLDDVTYRKTCINLKCISDCCEGDIKKLYCGLQQNCEKYQKYVTDEKTFLVLIAVLSIAGCLIILFLGFVFCNKQKKSKKEKAKEAGIMILALIFFPITIIYLLYIKRPRNR